MFNASVRTPLRRLALAAVTGSLVASVAVAGPAEARITAKADSSSDWLVSQLDKGLIVSEYNDGEKWVQYTDYGLSLDAYYAFDQLGVRNGKRSAILDAIESEAAQYTDAFGTTYAGAIGKLLTAVELNDIDPADYADGDLVERLEALVVTTGDETGRAKDDPADFDSSNTFGQSFVATALTGADSGLADEATEFLVKQQCAAGFFRQDMTSDDFTCDGGTEGQSAPSIDATATAAAALHAIDASGVSARVAADAESSFYDAVAWLVSKQKKNGTFAGGRNANSTGLAATALSLAGKDKKAERAAAWLNDLRVTKRLAKRTDFRKRDIGAVAYDAAALDTGKKKGITRGVRYEWRRATAQAAPALDLLG